MVARESFVKGCNQDARTMQIAVFGLPLPCAIRERRRCRSFARTRAEFLPTFEIPAERARIHSVPTELAHEQLAAGVQPRTNLIEHPIQVVHVMERAACNHRIKRTLRRGESLCTDALENLS